MITSSYSISATSALDPETLRKQESNLKDHNLSQWGKMKQDCDEVLPFVSLFINPALTAIKMQTYEGVSKIFRTKSKRNK
jgi:hypothetical protein